MNSPFFNRFISGQNGIELNIANNSYALFPVPCWKYHLFLLFFCM